MLIEHGAITNTIGFNAECCILWGNVQSNGWISDEDEEAVWVWLRAGKVDWLTKGNRTEVK